MSAASERQLGAIVADAGQVGELDHDVTESWSQMLGPSGQG
jgi:hypothetical protein